ncbi:hypothetical protein [Lutibacter sp.]|uniref:hypothetical protein n=1 Tax=Lutibacter sp. TaxID=1925666 RepID=UPI0025BE2592|nr:hypothetical protein [Lutibacter sp.]MCF6168826.1 hypothetical protein [Lutibacter sp.]
MINKPIFFYLKKYSSILFLVLVILNIKAQVSTCSELGLRPITPDGNDILKIYYDGNSTGVGGHGCWAHHHPNGKDYVITPHSWTREPNEFRQTLIKNAMQAIVDARKEYVNYGTLNNQLYYILNDVNYRDANGETFWLVGNKCWMRSGVPNLRNSSNEIKRFVYAHEVGHCFVMENVPNLNNQYHSMNHWFDESVAEFLASEVYKQINKEYEWARVFDVDNQTYRQPYAAYVLWKYYAMKKGKASVVALMNAFAETPSLNSRLNYLKNIAFDEFFQHFLFDFLKHKIPDSGNGDPIPIENIQPQETITLDPLENKIKLPNLRWGRANLFRLLIPSGYDLTINPPTGSNLKYFQSLTSKIEGVNIENWNYTEKINGSCSSEIPVWIMISHLNKQPLSNLSINYSLYKKSNCCSGFDNSKCLAGLTAKTVILANPEEVNGVFHFDYKIKSNIEASKSGKIIKFKNLTYYVNTADGSIYFPKESLAKMAGNISSKDGRVDGTIWLSNRQMVTYFYDAIYKKKRAFTVNANKSSNDVFMNEHLGFLQFFNNQSDTLAIKERPVPLPSTSKWQTISHGYAGKIINQDSEAKMTIYIDCNPPPIATGFPMIGFLVGVVKDHRIKKCNQLIVFNKIETGNDYIQAELLQISKESKTFDATSYKPGGLLKKFTKGSRTNMQNAKAKMDELQRKAIALGQQIQDLKKEKRKCREITKGDPTFCNKKYDPLIKKIKDEAKKLQYNLMKNMGVEDLIKN